MTKSQRLKIARQICDNYKTGDYTIKSCIENAGIPERTFHDWIEKGNNTDKKTGYVQIARLYSKAQDEKRQRYKRKLQHLTMASIERLLTEFTYEEKTVEYETDEKTKQKKINRIKVTTKHVLPNATMAIFIAKSVLGITEDGNSEDQTDILADIAAAMRDQIKMRPTPPGLHTITLPPEVT